MLYHEIFGSTGFHLLLQNYYRLVTIHLYLANTNTFQEDITMCFKIFNNCDLLTFIRNCFGCEADKSLSCTDFMVAGGQYFPPATLSNFHPLVF